MRLVHLIIAFAFAASVLAPISSFAGPQEGRKAWMKLNCNGCHGNNGGGGMGPNIRDQEAHDISTAMHGDAREGGMRSYVGVSQFGPTDAADIAAYLRTVGTPQEPTWVDWWRH
jgi:cytochrome c551